MEENFQRLEKLVKKADGIGIVRFPPEEMEELGLLYRRATGEVAHLRATGQTNGPRFWWLNNLVFRASGYLYSSRRPGPGVVDFLLTGLPKAVYRSRKAILLAAAIFLAGVVSGWLLQVFGPADLTQIFLPPGQARRISTHPSYTSAWGPFMSSFIMTNNIKVAILAFATGIFAGVPTAWVLFSNGLLLGILAALYAGHGYSLFFWSLILPHGVLELPAIFLSGGAGFLLAGAVIAPGDLYRSEALRRAAKTALPLFLGTVPVSILAGLIEGFLTPSSLEPWLKLGFAGALLGLLLLYLGRGRKATPARGNWR